MKKSDYFEEVSKKKFDRLIIALAKNIVLSAEFADINTEGHQSRGEIAQSMADLQTDIDNREALIMHNSDYQIPPEEKTIFQEGSDYLCTACEQWGIKNPLDDYEDANN